MGDSDMTRWMMLLLICVSTNACVAVRAVDRGRLADPVMVPELERDAQRYRGHVLEVREASRGGLVLEGAGCGCN
jgi:uncharacterized protein DUF4266